MKYQRSKNKFSAAIPVTVNGTRYASKGEYARAKMLNMQQEAGLISELKMQVRFNLVVNSQRVGTYTPDFTYRENGKLIAEDFKGRKARDFALRSKLFQALYPEYTLRITGKDDLRIRGRK